MLPSGSQDVEVGAATKVIPWPRRKAVVGYCGLGQLAGLPLEEWMRQFVAHTRDFCDLSQVAVCMRDLIQQDFDRDHPQGTDVADFGLIVHLGGFLYRNGVAVPVMFYTSNVPGYDDQGEYHDAERNFSKPQDHLKLSAVPHGVQTASEYRPWLQTMYAENKLVWFNNGLAWRAFNIFKDDLWMALANVREQQAFPILPSQPTFGDYCAYCAMAVELFGSFFSHHLLPQHRSVGGGVDVQWVPWPEHPPE